MKKRAVIAPPSEWVSMLDIHELELTRVRLLWRTGSSKYRPLIPITADFEALESATERAWEALEIPDTHFHWVRIEADTPAERLDSIRGVAARMWSFSRRFARALDKRCDFQLRGYGDGDVILFEVGARHDPKGDERAGAAPSQTQAQGGPRPGAGESSASGSSSITDEFTSPRWDPAKHEEERRRIDQAKDSLITRLTEERNRTDDRFREMAQESPALITHASDILDRAVAYQERAVENLVNQRTGEIEHRIRAFAEEQETHREALRLDWRRYAVDALLGNLVPLGKTVFEAWANQSGHPFPTFQHVQQALAYLGMTLDESQQAALFHGNLQAAKTFVDLLEYASGQEIEHEAILALKGCETVFRSQRFKTAATSEQQLAARFVLRQAALYRMGDFQSSTDEST